MTTNESISLSDFQRAVKCLREAKQYYGVYLMTKEELLEQVFTDVDYYRYYPNTNEIYLDGTFSAERLREIYNILMELPVVLFKKEWLEQLHFRKWWIKHNARELIKNPLLMPTREDYMKYLDDPEVISFFS